MTGSNEPPACGGEALTPSPSLAHEQIAAEREGVGALRIGGDDAGDPRERLPGLAAVAEGGSDRVLDLHRFVSVHGSEDSERRLTKSCQLFAAARV